MLISINGTDISLQTIYGTYLNENFYLIKINIPHPKKKHNNKSITVLEFIIKNC